MSDKPNSLLKFWNELKRLKMSDAIIVVLFVAVCVLLYPKIFNPDKFEDIRDEDGRITIAVMPFEHFQEIQEGEKALASQPN